MLNIFPSISEEHGNVHDLITGRDYDVGVSMIPESLLCRHLRGSTISVPALFGSVFYLSFGSALSPEARNLRVQGLVLRRAPRPLFVVDVRGSVPSLPQFRGVWCECQFPFSSMDWQFVRCTALHLRFYYMLK